MAKSKRVMKKKAKRRLMVFGTLSCFMIAYFIFSSTLAVIKITRLSNENKSLQTELKNLKKEERDLNVEIQKLKDPDYLARYARENYLYSKDGEYIIKLDEEKKEKSKVEDISLEDYKYILFCGGFFVLLLMIWLIKKVKEK